MTTIATLRQELAEARRQLKTTPPGPRRVAIVRRIQRLLIAMRGQADGR